MQSNRTEYPKAQYTEPIGPTRPAIIAHRYWCPSCDAQPGEPCRLNARFTQEYSHEARHQVARRALWLELSRELSLSTGWTVGDGR
jgi:hypothetical protein